MKPPWSSLITTSYTSRLVDASTASTLGARGASQPLSGARRGLGVLGPDAHLVGLRIDLRDAPPVLPGRFLGRSRATAKVFRRAVPTVSTSVRTNFLVAQAVVVPTTMADCEHVDDSTDLHHCDSPFVHVSRVFRPRLLPQSVDEESRNRARFLWLHTPITHP